ncbi:hypothetical protein BUALT_Bualt07G0064400 [Buddleja alternifolia]|uniref:Uncharacterized protein n=1 Tax=Buddleja alternifolia TaxID=168488 RepID=A0AAV6XD41_9LAMI|nr:hypothetical protein BUALT_Bualt07G0064400 [Buddleja alternifolia]
MAEYLEDGVTAGRFSGSERRWRCLIHLSKLLHEGTPLEELMITTQQHHKSSTITTTYNDHHHDFLDHKGSVFKKGRRSPRKKKSIFINPDHEGQLMSLKITMIKKMCTTTLSKKIITMIKKSKSDTSSSNAELPHYLGKRRSRTDHDSQNQEKKRAAMKKVKVPETSPRQLPEEFKNHILDIGGCLEKLVLVIEKRLFKTDVSSLHSRLSVPYSQVVNPFLEQSDVDDLDHTPKAEIKATLVQPCLRECEISLRNWKTNNQYALVTRFAIGMD